MELDKRVGKYATAIVHDADLLLEDIANLNDEHKQYAGELKRFAVMFLSIYNEGISYLTELNRDTRILIVDLRQPLANIAGYCELLLRNETGNLSQSQLQLLQQIKVAQDFILNAFTIWVNSEYPKYL